jgi:hypothetical protein
LGKRHGWEVLESLSRVSQDFVNEVERAAGAGGAGARNTGAVRGTAAIEGLPEFKTLGLRGGRPANCALNSSTERVVLGATAGCACSTGSTTPTCLPWDRARSGKGRSIAY